MREEGYSLVELLIVLAFLGIILLIATPLTLENIRRARAENQAQTLYSNIAEARQRSVQRNLNYILKVSDAAVLVYEDTNNNATADASEKVNLLSATGMTYPLNGTVGTTAISATAQNVTVNRKGFIQPTVTMYVNQEAAHNCLLVDFTRVSIGKYNGSICKVQ